MTVDARLKARSKKRTACVALIIGDQPMDDVSKFEPTEDFALSYANNVRYEASVWDLKMIFGQLDQRAPEAVVVEQHTAVTVTWQMAKLMAYFCTVNVVLNQIQTGAHIVVPPTVIPPKPDPSLEGWKSADPKLVRYLAWIHDQYFGANPYIPPGVEQES
jgi:hypothetical protein